MVRNKRENAPTRKTKIIPNTFGFLIVFSMLVPKLGVAVLMSEGAVDTLPPAE